MHECLARNSQQSSCMIINKILIISADYQPEWANACKRATWPHRRHLWANRATSPTNYSNFNSTDTVRCWSNDGDWLKKKSADWISKINWIKDGCVDQPGYVMTRPSCYVTGPNSNLIWCLLIPITLISFAYPIVMTHNRVIKVNEIQSRLSIRIGADY